MQVTTPERPKGGVLIDILLRTVQTSSLTHFHDVEAFPSTPSTAVGLNTIPPTLAIRRDVDDLGNIGDVKTYKHRDVPIGGEVLQLLASAVDGRDDDAWLVPDEHGKVWTTARWRKIWATILIHTGINGLDTYELRHTAASLAIAAGADVKTVQLMLGHSSATTTLDVYGHLWEEGLDTLPGAMDALMAKERECLATEAESREESEAERRRARFKVIG